MAPPVCEEDAYKDVSVLVISKVRLEVLRRVWNLADGKNIRIEDHCTRNASKLDLVNLSSFILEYNSTPSFIAEWMIYGSVFEC